MTVYRTLRSTATRLVTPEQRERILHEEVRLTRAEAGRTALSPRVPVTAPIPEDVDGDYSYDLAHDIPAQGS